MSSSKKEDSRLETAVDEGISSTRFKVKGILGKGHWGTVYRVEDTITGKDYALKKSTPSDLAREQMKHRNLDENDVMLKELQKKDGDLAPSKYLVPRWMEVGENGELQLIMNIFQSTFADVIGDNGDRRWLNNGLTFEKVRKYAVNIAEAFAEYEKKYDGPHCDAKSFNMMMGSEGEILLNDMGISTCVSSKGDDPRDNMGSVYVRSPENFRDGDHPKKSSGVWSFGANIARLLSGKYPLEDRLNEDIDYVKNHTDEQLKKEINLFIKKNIPRKWRKPLKKWLSPYSYERPYDAQQLKKDLTETLKKMDVKEYFGEQLKRYGLKAGMTFAVVGALSYAILTKEATKMEIPDIQNRPTIYKDAEVEGKVIFKFENHPEYKGKLNDLLVPSIVYSVGSMDMFTNNYYVARLMELYNHSLSQTGGLFGHRLITDEQVRMYNSLYGAYGGGVSTAVEQHKLASVFEYALGEAKIKSAQKSDSTFVDAEDFTVIARLGKDKLSEAWKYSGSTKYSDYINAKYPDGKPVIENSEKEFIDQWIFDIINSGRYLRIAQEPDSSRSE